MNSQLIFSLISAAATIGGICIAVGMSKAKVNQSADVNDAQSKEISKCATKEELNQAIKRSDEMLEILSKRIEEDRIGTEYWRKEFLELSRGHGERLAALETMHSSQTKILDKLEGTVNLGFKELREDLKELQRRILLNGKD